MCTLEWLFVPSASFTKFTAGRRMSQSVGIKSGSWRTHTRSARHTHFRCWVVVVGGVVERPLPIKCHNSSSYGADKNRSIVLEDLRMEALLVLCSASPERRVDGWAPTIGAPASFLPLDGVALFLCRRVQICLKLKMSPRLRGSDHWCSQRVFSIQGFDKHRANITVEKHLSGSKYEGPLLWLLFFLGFVQCKSFFDASLSFFRHEWQTSATDVTLLLDYCKYSPHAASGQ